VNQNRAQWLTTEPEAFLTGLSWRNAVSVYQIRANQRANEPDAFFYQIYGGTVQLQLVAPTDIAAKIKGPAIAYQSAYLINSGANRYHRWFVAPS
jgi:hypothetical protein